jgi:hypothetical protein
MTSCFRNHWPGGSTLSDSELQALMSTQQGNGHLVTGLRRWKMRQSSRSTLELSIGEKWICPQGCGQVYRVSSTRSIQKHMATCKQRSSEKPTDHTGYRRDDFVNFSLVPVVAGDGKQGEDLREGRSESELEQPVALTSVPGQFDGFQEDTQLEQDMDESDHVLLPTSSSFSLSPSHALPTFNFTTTLDWEDTPMHRLLRRQQLETESLSAQHFMEVVALRDQSVTDFHTSALWLSTGVIRTSTTALSSLSSSPPHHAHCSYCP